MELEEEEINNTSLGDTVSRDSRSSDILDGQENIYSPTTADIYTQDVGGSCLKKIYYHFFPLGYKSEFKILIKLSWPIVLVQFCEQFLFMLSFMFCGHLGKNELAGIAMALTLINVAGCSILQGLAAGCETLFSQTYGTKNKMRVGIILQQSIIILGLACLPCWALLINVDHVLILVGQPPAVAKSALIYSLYFIPGLPGYALCMIITRYLRCQSIVIPSFVLSVLSNILTAVYHAIFIFWWKLGIGGAGLALSLGFWTNGILHIVYIIVTKLYKITWPGVTWKCLEDWKMYMSLALPGMFMLCLEWWSFEILVFLAGRLGTTSLAAHGIIYQMAAITFMTPMGLAQAGCVRVSNLLGEGRHQLAMTSGNVIISFTFVVALIDSVILVSFKDYIPLAFTQDKEVKELTSSLLLVLAVFHFADASEGVASGIIRGAGKQKFGSIINLIAYYIIGVPVAVCLMFLTPLKVAGAWWGICFGSVFQCVAYFIKIYMLNWVQEAKMASERAGVQTTKIHGIPDEVSSSSDDQQHLIEADQLLLSTDSLASLTSTDTQTIESQKSHQRHLVFVRLIPLACCVLILIVSVIIRESIAQIIQPPHCILMNGDEFNLTFVHELITHPNSHNLSREELEMLNMTYYYEQENFGNLTFVYCPDNIDDYYRGNYINYNDTKLYQFFHPSFAPVHPFG